MVPTPKIAPVYEVLVHTPELLVLQTNAGAELSIAKLPYATIASASPITSSYGCFNLGLHVQDDAKHVLVNRARLLVLMNAQLALQSQKYSKSIVQIEAIYWLNQIHSNKVVRIDDSSRLSLTAPTADALVSHLPYRALAIMTADCVPIVLYDPNSKQIAAIHAGWQGLAKGVIGSTYAELTDKKPPLTTKLALNSEIVNTTSPFQTWRPVQAWIGACISQQCYEVSIAVVDKLLAGCAQLGMDTKKVHQQAVATHKKADKAWIDLPKLAQLQLQQLGVELQQPSTSEADYSGAYACSYRNNRYYSYRRQTHLGEGNTGRMAMLIARLS